MSQTSRSISPHRPNPALIGIERNASSTSRQPRRGVSEVDGSHSFAETSPASPTPDASLASALNEPSTSIVHVPGRPRTPPLPLETLLSRASELLDAKDASQAIRLLMSVPASASERSCKYQDLLAQAHRACVESLEAAGSPGEVRLDCRIEADKVSISAIFAERLDCYGGICEAYVRHLSILREATVRQQFISEHGEEALKTCEAGVKAGLAYALLEMQSFLNRIFLCNSNQSTAGFLERMLATGRLTEQDSTVRDYRKVQADPLYHQFVAVGKEINEALKQTDEPATLVWHAWLDREQKRFLDRPEAAAASAALAETLPRC